MENMTCPKCQAEMQAQRRGGVEIAQCSSCQGVFLDRADRSALIEHETEWHVSRGPQTQPLPRITSEMTSPPPSPKRERSSQSYIDLLFG